jgi:hypothetical protein
VRTATPGDRAIAYASLAQVEITLSLAELIEKAAPIPMREIATALLEAEDVLASSSVRRRRIYGEDDDAPA